MSDVAHKLDRETVAALNLLRDMQEILGDDEQVKFDAMEGETGLFEAIDRVVQRIALLSAHMETISSHIADLDARKSRFSTQTLKLRQALLRTLTGCGIAKVERAIATLSVQNLPRQMVAVDESLIPAEFIVVERRLNRSAIKAALKNGHDIPGTRLDNGGETVRITFK